MALLAVVTDSQQQVRVTGEGAEGTLSCGVALLQLPCRPQFKRCLTDEPDGNGIQSGAGRGTRTS